MERELAQQIEAHFAAIRAAERNVARRGLPKLAPLGRKLEQYVLLYKLRLYCRYLSYADFSHPSQLDLSESDFSWLQAWLAEKPTSLFSVPTLQFYYLLLQLIDPALSSDKDPQQLVQQILSFSQNYPADIDRDDRIDVLSIVTNYCTKAINLGLSDYRPLQLQLYVQMIDIQHGQKAQKGEALAPEIFQNVVKLALPGLAIDWPSLTLHGVAADNAFDWVAAFIQQYGKRLKSVDAKATIAFCKATNLFHATRYAEALKLLQKMPKSQAMVLAISLKVLSLKCLYELESAADSESKKLAKKSGLRIPNLLEAYRKQLDYWEHENPSLGYIADYHRVFIKAFGDLYALHQKGYHHSHSLQDHRRLDAAQKKQVAALSEHSYPFVPWLREKLLWLGK